MSYKTYRSKGSVKARKVTEETGETVVTSTGIQHAAKGDFIVLDENGGSPTNRVLSAEDFAANYDAGTQTATESSSDTPPVVAGTQDDEKTAAAKATAAERVKAAKAAKKAASPAKGKGK